MIIYSETKEEVLNYIQNDIEEMENIKILYQNKFKFFKKYLKKIDKKKIEEINIFNELLHTIEDNLKNIENQVKKLRRRILVVTNMENNNNDNTKKNNLQKGIKRYNQSYNRFKKELIEQEIVEQELMRKCIQKSIFTGAMTNSMNSEFIEKEDTKLEENITNENIIDEKMIEDNDTLLISEIKNKVILPYKGAELEEILKSDENGYSDVQMIIDEKYTIPLINYKHAMISRYREAFALMREKEKASIFDSLDLALELMRNRYVHPAIITACKDLDQLDVYLDCLEMNELDDFPFFKIEYELYPIKVKTKLKPEYTLE